MNTQNPYAAAHTLDARIAVHATTEARRAFIQRTYLHVAGALAAFTVLEAALLRMPGIERILASAFALPASQFIMLALFIGSGWVSDRWARSDASQGMQYAGLALSVVAHAVFFLPLLFMATNYGGPTLVPAAAITTGAAVIGLSAVVFIMGADFSFMRVGLGLGFMVALGVILASMLFGFQLGVWFAGAMVLLLCGSILYNTSAVLHHYRTEQHVAASLSLFGSIAMLFYYVLMLFMSRD